MSSIPVFSGASAEHRNCRVLLQAAGEPPYLDTTPGDVLATFNAAVLGQLVITDESFNLNPGLLESFRFDYETSRYHLKLKKGLKFHNGRAVTSADLEFAILRGFFSKNRSFYNIYLNNIAGIHQVPQGSKYKSGLVSGVRIIDEQSVEVRLEHPNPSFLHSLSQPFFSLVPIEEFEGDYLTWRHWPVGAGPYKVSPPGFAKGHIQLSLVDDSLRSKGAPETIELYTAANSGHNFDVIMGALQKDDGYREWHSNKPASVRTIFFSNVNPLGKNKNFRLAVTKLINRSKIVAGRSDMDPANEILPKHFWGRINADDPFDLDAAKKLLSKVPQELLKNALRIPVFSKGGFSEQQQHYINGLKEQFAAAGIKLEFFALAEKFPTRSTAENYAFRIAGRVTDYVDPLIMFGSFHEGSPYQFDQPTGDDKQKFEELYSAAASARSLDERYASVRALSKFIAETGIAVSIAEERSTYLYNPQRIESFGTQPSPLILLLRNLTLKR